MRTLVVSMLSLVALAACGQPAEKAAEAPADAAAPVDTALIDKLTDCAGALAAQGDMNIVTGEGVTGNPWETGYMSVMNQLEKQGVEFATRRDGAVARQQFWEANTAETQEEKATACRAELAPEVL